MMKATQKYGKHGKSSGVAGAEMCPERFAAFRAKTPFNYGQPRERLKGEGD